MDKLLEYFGVISGLLYLYLEIKQKSSMWIVGLITSLIYVFVFFQAKFYADMGLNIYYLGISIYGLVLWRRKMGEDVKSTKEEDIEYTNISFRQIVVLGIVFVVLYLGLAHILQNLTDSPVPYGDALTTSLGIIATWMLAKRIIQHWIIWVFVNAFAVYLYIYRGLHPTAFLYLCYGVLAIVGFYNWKKNGTYIKNIS